MMPVLDCGEMWGHRIAVILRLFNFEEFAILIPVINEIFFFLILVTALMKECVSTIIVLNFAFIFVSVLGVREITSG